MFTPSTMSPSHNIKKTHHRLNRGLQNAYKNSNRDINIAERVRKVYGPFDSCSLGARLGH